MLCGRVGVVCYLGVIVLAGQAHHFCSCFHTLRVCLLAAAAAGDKLERRQLGYLLARQGVQLDLEEGLTAVEVCVSTGGYIAAGLHGKSAILLCVDVPVAKGPALCKKGLLFWLTAMFQFAPYVTVCQSRSCVDTHRFMCHSTVQDDEERDVLREIISNSKLSEHFW